MLTAQETTDYYRVVEECFAGDKELLEEFHICAPCSLKQAVTDTVNVLKSGSVHPDFTMYKLLIGTELVGFFGTELNNTFLTTFCLKKEYRRPDILEGFWEIINQYLPGTFRTALYTRNSRAVKFMLNNGGEVKKRFLSNGKPAVLLELAV